jgi:phospholipid/cholesterol/gamma-HCH transport system permease protein
VIDALASQRDRLFRFFEHVGAVSVLVKQTFGAIGKRPLEWASAVQQAEAFGVRSMGIVTVTSVFIGMVMTIQFAWGLRRFGGVEYIPRVVALAFVRELGPTLTAVIVGGRIASGMTAEVGSMNVTEQVDAIRALGADPVKKLVMPRVVAAILVMPLLSAFAIALGLLGAILVCAAQFGITPQAFLLSGLDTLTMRDFIAGMSKTPVYGLIISTLGCYFGLKTTGGTEGVGLSTTRSVVAVSISVLVADFLMTKIFILIGIDA